MAQLVGSLTEHVSKQDKRILDLEAQHAVTAQLDDEQSGDLTAQVHMLTAYVRGLAQKVGYVHKTAPRV